MPGPYEPGSEAAGPDGPGEEGPGPDTAGDDGTAAGDTTGKAAARRARRLAEVFGDVLPEGTSDDRDGESRSDPERWYAENRPPHHDPR